MNLVYRFSGPVTNKVIHSQVVGTLEALRLEGLQPNLLGWCGLGHALRNRAAYREAVAAISQSLQAPFAIRHTMDRWPALDRWLKRRELQITLSRLAPDPAGRPITLQTRSHDLAILMANLRLGNPALRFVYELRGDLRAERQYQRGATLDRGLAAVEEAMTQALAVADLVLCVSEVLARQVAVRYGVPQERLHVMPCTADEERFRPDPALKEQRRRELGLGQGDFLLVYSGSLSKGWDVPEQIRAFLKANLERQANLHVLLVSPDTAQASDLQRWLPRGRVHHRRLDHWEMQGWLCAGDAALLLREAHPLNESASPTKAAELLLCGLPLLISPGVGDYSGWVESRKLGRVMGTAPLVSRDWEDLRALKADEIRRQALELVARTPHVHRLARMLTAL